jgi:hypothetical protein
MSSVRQRLHPAINLIELEKKEDTMNRKHLLSNVSVLLFIASSGTAIVIAGSGAAIAGKTVNEVGALVCVTDKWEEKEPEKGHKLADGVFRCVVVPDDPAAPKYAEDCVGKYEYMPDESWKSAGTCTLLFKGGDKVYDTWEEGSHLKEYVYKVTGGTGKYKGASGGGTYTYENLTDTLAGGRYKGKIELP